MGKKQKPTRSFYEQDLRVRAALSVTLVADEHVRFGSSHLRQLMFSDGLFSESLSDLFQLGTRHLLETQTHTQL